MKIWLIKSSGKILGPLDSSEIEESLRQKQTAFFDEIKGPLERWKFIREHPGFQNMVAALRDETQQQMEETTQVSEESDDESTLTPTEKPVLDLGPQVVLSRARVEYENRLPSPYVKTQKVVFNTGDVGQKSSSKKIYWVGLLFFVLLVALMAFFFLQKMGPSKTRSSLELARDSFETGAYADSFVHYSALSAPEFSDQDHLNFAKILYHLRGQGGAAQERLSQMSVSSGPSIKSQAENLDDLIRRQKNPSQNWSLRLAQKSQEHPQDLFWSINHLTYLYQSSDFSEALQASRRYSQKGQRSIEAILVEGLSALKLGSPVQMDQILVRLDEWPGRARETERKVLRFLLLSSLGSSDQSLRETLEQILSVSPLASREEVENLNLDSSFWRWETWLPSCEAVYANRPQFETHWMLAYCFFQAGQYQKTLNILETLQKQSPDDKAVRFLLGFHYLESNRMAETKALIKSSGGSNFLARLQLHLCLRQHLSCEKEMKEVLELHPHDLEASAYLGLHYLDFGDRQQAFDLYKTVQTLNPDFRLVRRLKAKGGF